MDKRIKQTHINQTPVGQEQVIKYEVKQDLKCGSWFKELELPSALHYTL